MNTSHRPGQDEHGAVAIVVALALVVLLVMSAFAVDFGLAYTNDRQLQTAADAAALAAVSVYQGQPGSCGVLVTDASLRSAAHARGTSIMNDNHSQAVGPDPATWTASCSSDGKVSLSWSADDPVDTGLGGVVGLAEIQTGSQATAAIIAGPGTATGLRPYAVCDSEIPTVLPSAATRVNFEGHSAGFECDGPPGNWRQVDCPLNGSPPKPDPAKLADATLVGCTLDVSVVADQEPPGDAALRQTLLDACPAGGDSDEDCLSGNTGSDFKNNQVLNAWDTLLGQEISLPVVCGATACPGSVPAGEPAFVGNGTKAQLPVHRIVKATVCGFHWDKSPAKARKSSPDPVCAGTPYSPGGPLDPALDTSSSDQYLVLIFDELIGEGSSSGGGTGDLALTE